MPFCGITETSSDAESVEVVHDRSVEFWDKNFELSKEPEESYDGLFISNVIDVIPMEITRDILANAKRVLKKGAKIVIGMNNYLSPEIAKSKDYTVKEDRYLFVDKILRLVLMSDEEWTSLLSEYFTVTKLDHFSWPGEETETRRLFFLQNE